MRMLFAAVAVGALAFASSAAAVGPVTLQPVSFSPEFQTALHDDLGAREGVYLSGAVTRAVSRELEAHGATMGGGGVTIELSIIDADPNRPTMQQAINEPGLDIMRSISLGGAELHATLRAADGHVLGEVSHRRYDNSLVDLPGPPVTWQAAERAIRQFADKVADAYVAETR